MGTLLPFLENYCAADAKKYCAFKREEIVNLTIFAGLVFCTQVILGGYFLNISKTIFTKLVFHLCLSDQLLDVLLQ